MNLAADPKYAKIKERFRRYLPTKNMQPSSMKGGGLDSHGRKVEALRKEGVPDWLGKAPETKNEETKG